MKLNTFASISSVVWAFTILIGTGYVIFFLGYSGWWWLLAILLLSADFKPVKK